MIPTGLKRNHIMLAVKEIDQMGVPQTREARKYFLKIDGKEYPVKYVISISNKYLNGAEWPYTNFNAVEAKNYFETRGYDVIDKSSSSSSSIDEEREWRILLWEELGGTQVASGITPQELRDLDIYGGQQGIWVDKKRTQSLTSDEYGIAVSVIHKGDRYPDDFDETGVIYHYPKTDRPRSRDLGEIEAVKNCNRYDLPIFVIRVSPENSQLREVYMGYVTYWDDESEVFIIEFGDIEAVNTDELRDEVFQIKENSVTRKYATKALSRDAGFRIASLRRYGTKCAVCEIGVVELLDAAHIVPKAESGTDDERNGIVLCSLHHRAFDRGLFAINPESLEIVPTLKGPSLKQMGITQKSISHLQNFPHKKALEIAWQKTIVTSGN